MENTPLDTSFIPGQGESFDPRDRLAGRGKRFANFIIDFIITRIGVVLVFVILFSSRTIDPGDANTLVELAVTIPIVVLYYSILEGATGKTLGKLITRTRVVGKDGEKPSWSRIIGRSFARFIPFEPLSFLGSEVGWHDSASDTYVIND